MRMLGWAVVAIIGTGAPGVSAASLYPEAGVTRVNFGNGYRPVKAPTVLLAGSKILVAPKGEALLVYSPTCRVRLGSGLWNVLDTQPCSADNETLDFSSRMNQGAPDMENAEVPQDGSIDGGASAGAAGGISTTTLVVGGLVVAGGVAAAIGLSQGGGSDKPASP